ncbi:NADH-quinone oxidoreductase subunit C [Candidatus Uhrbacteria bacterium]|nr:NADH-quinone oxidoreductase subunit C [Candidatus Uhrbacteria bacterium]
MTVDQIREKYISKKYEVKQDGNVLSFQVPPEDIISVCRQLYFHPSLQLKTITATDERKAGIGFRILYAFGVPKENIFLVPFIVLNGKEEFPSLTRAIHEASIYERKIRSLFGLEPVGHPNPRPLLLHENWPSNIFPLRKDFHWQERPAEANGTYEFRKVEGEGVYEIPVGPVHAGIIEPGHFRFSVAGEEIVLLEARLGFTHKGTEKLFEVFPLGEKVTLSERVSGDSSFTHSMAFCQALENLSEIEIPKRANYVRVIFSELERLANHCNDVGFIMLDTGYSFGGTHGARLREMIMQWNERLAGSRFLRGLNCIGGITRDISDEMCGELRSALTTMRKDFSEMIEISEDSSTMLNRLEGTGKLDRQIAADHGIIGIAGRSVGLEHDARKEYPYAAYNNFDFEIAMENAGDVRARFNVRVKEIHSSFEILDQALRSMPSVKDIAADKKVEFRKNSCAVGVAEAWRGDVVYFVVTDADGKISRVDVRDPSFLNWHVLGHAGNGNVVPDFPLINKSFNLSYSGYDV